MKPKDTDYPLHPVHVNENCWFYVEGRGMCVVSGGVISYIGWKKIDRALKACRAVKRARAKRLVNQKS